MLRYSVVVFRQTRFSSAMGLASSTQVRRQEEALYTGLPVPLGQQTGLAALAVLPRGSLLLGHFVTSLKSATKVEETALAHVIHFGRNRMIYDMLYYTD